MMAHSFVENVVKQGYLKRGNYGTNRLSGFFRRNETNKWFVFTIRQGVPFLEYYDSDVDVFTQQPINSFNLSTCQNVKSMGNSSPPSFCIVCPDRVIELIASSRTQMVEWVNEVEASLTRLGILKNELIDHVYTVCPAVVRKPRASKEVHDEAEIDAQEVSAPTTTSAARATGGPSTQPSSSQADITLPTNFSPTREKSLTLKPNPRPQMMNRYSYHGPSSVDLTPPPLPLRTSSHPDRMGALRQTDNFSEVTESTENSFQYPSTEGSNDSDFVSADVIAELRKQRQVSTRAVNLSSERGVEVTTGSTPHFESSIMPDGSSPLERPTKVEVLVEGQPQTYGASGGYPAVVDSISDPTLFLESDNCLPDNMTRIRDVVENDYAAFPCHYETFDSGISCTGDNDSDVLVISKPTPVPRKTAPRMFSSLDELPLETHPAISENKNLVTSVTSEESGTFHTVFQCDDDYVGFEPIKYNNIEHKQLINNDIVSTADQPEDIGAGCSRLSPFKLTETNFSKDENENFYCHMLDLGPPVTMASSVPPLPLRQDSLQARGDSNKSIATSKSAILSHDSNSLPASLSTSSAFSAAASNKHKGIFYDNVQAPPLLLPRIKGSNSSQEQWSPPASAFTSSNGVDVPPLLPRRGNQHFSQQSLEEKPPALPSRNSQSFFIKRPQITGISNNIRISNEDLSNQNADQPLASKDHQRRNERHQETGAASNGTALSRKMLLDHSHSLHTVVSLKQTQAEILQMEISMPRVEITLTQKSGHGLALVDWNGMPCVVGWNQRDFPSLHGKLHLGDLIHSINKVRVTGADTAHKLLKQASASKIEIVLRRMPYAKVFAIHRDVEGQSLGIRREGGTGEKHGPDLHSETVIYHLKSGINIIALSKHPQVLNSLP